MKDFVKAVAIVSLVFLATGILGSFIYDENDEPAMESLFRGLYLDTPITHIDFGGFKGIAVFYAFLYSKFDFGINYFGISLIFFNWLAFILLIFILLKKRPAHAFLWSLLFLFVAFYNIFIVSFTTTSILASFAGQLLFLYALTDIESFKIKSPLILLSSVVIVLAYLVRPASGTLGFILFAPVAFWNLLFNEKASKKILSLLIVLPFILSVFIAKQIDKKESLENGFNGKAISIYSKITNYGYALNFNDKTQEKLLYEVNNWFFFDKDTQNIKNYENLLLKPKKLSNAKYAFTYVFVSLVGGRSLIFICIITMALFMLILFKLKNIKVMIFCLSIGYYLGVLSAIALFMKMVPRVLIPTLVIVIYYIFITFPTLWQFNKQKLSRFFSGTIICILILLACFQTWSLANDLSIEKRKAGKCLAELNNYLNSAKPEYVFLTWAYEINYYPLKHIKGNPGVKLIPLAGWMSYYPQNYAFLKKLAGSNDVQDIFKWIAAHPGQAAVYSDKGNNLVLNKIFAYHNIKAFLVPSKILNKESGKGFYQISFN